MTSRPPTTDRASAKIDRALVELHARGEDALAALARLQEDVIEAAGLLEGARAAQLLQSAENLGVATRRALELTHELKAVSQLADLDPLTELPNRALLHDRLERAISHARRHEKRIAVLFLDLNNFKHINDTLGHGVGDQMLRIAAGRLTVSIREADTVGRLGGDEFVILLTEVSKASDAIMIAEKITAVLGAPCQVGDAALHLSASIGISLYPDDGADSDTLVDRADAAMYLAKRQGAGSFVFHGQNLASKQVVVAAATELAQRTPNPQYQSAAALPSAFCARPPEEHEHSISASPENATSDPDFDPGLPVVIDILEVLERASTAPRLSMAERSQRFTVNIPETPVTLLGRPALLVQAFQALLDHASLHTTEGGKIELTAELVDGSVVITVTDDGLGIRAAALDTFFEAFDQRKWAMRSNVNAAAGHIARTRDVIEAHGGHIVARSPGLGLGSCFIATLPLTSSRVLP